MIRLRLEPRPLLSRADQKSRVQSFYDRTHYVAHTRFIFSIEPFRAARWNLGLSNYDACHVTEGKNFYWEPIRYCHLFHRYKEKIQDS